VFIKLLLLLLLLLLEKNKLLFNIIKNKLLFPINKNNNLVDYIKKCSSTQQKKLFSYKKNNLNRNKSFNKGIFSDLKPFQLFKNDINNF